MNRNLTREDIEKKAEDLAERFSVNSNQMPLSREERGMVSDIFFAALMEYKDLPSDDHAAGIILDMSKRIIERYIGNNRADLNKNVAEALTDIFNA